MEARAWAHIWAHPAASISSAVPGQFVICFFHTLPAAASQTMSAVQRRGEFSARNISNTLWALAKINHHPGDEFLQVGHPCCGWKRPPLNGCWGCGQDLINLSHVNLQDCLL